MHSVYAMNALAMPDVVTQTLPEAMYTSALEKTAATVMRHHNCMLLSKLKCVTIQCNGSLPLQGKIVALLHTCSKRKQHCS
jgi:hypothetical protein